MGASLLFPDTRRFLLDRLRGSWPAICGGAAVALAALLPFAAIYLPAMRATDDYPYFHILPMIPRPRHFLDLGGSNPVWGGLSDRIGRRPTLLVTLAGTLAGYVLWIFSGSFALLIGLVAYCQSRLAAGLEQDRL